jgi:integrase
MKMKFTQSNVTAIKPGDKPGWIFDTEIKNLKLYVGAGGSKVWYLYYRDEHGKDYNRKIGSFPAITVAQARDIATVLVGRLIRGESLKKEKPSVKITLGALLDEYEKPYLLQCKSGAKTLFMIRSAFKDLLSKKANEITPFMIEKWRVERGEAGNKNGTINKRLASLRAALRWGVDNKLLEESPIQNIKRLSERRTPKVRYLGDDERRRLFEALDGRETRMRDGRRNHNELLAARKYALKPLLEGEYVDFLKPSVHLSLNTGIRRDNLFSLRWGDIDFKNRIIRLRAEETKSGTALDIPLNDPAFEVLTKWREQSPKASLSALVFPSPKTGMKLDNCDISWRNILKTANITDFRWHDMRHDFASRLVMQGVPLNTVRELLGHADLKTTLIYAHLAPSAKREAVALLNDTPKRGVVIGHIPASA